MEFKLKRVPEEKQISIVKNVSGQVRPGELIAVLGPSGAGKTSLLNILSGRLWLSPNDELTGKVLFNGAPRDKTWPRRIGYIEASDAMFPYMKVEETIQFSADTKLPESFTKGERKAMVDYMIKVLGLEKVRYSLIGGARVRGISSGERKLVSIAIEMINFPSLLIFDEPTSELDSAKAFTLMKYLKFVAHRFKIAVIITIHQPRLAIMNIFDGVMFLSHGSVVYQGPFENCIEYFERESGIKLDKNENPADYVLDLITSIPEDPKSESRVERLITSWESHANHDFDDHFEPSSSDTVFERPNSIFQEFAILWKRYCTLFTRDTYTIAANIAQAVFLSLLLSFVYFQVGDDYAGVLDRLGLLYFICVSLVATIGMPLWSVFAIHRNVYMRERATGSYRVFPSYLAKFVCLLPFSMFLLFIFVVPLYFIAGLAMPFDVFLAFMAQVIALRFAAVTLGLMIAAISSTVEFSLIIGPLLIIFLTVFGGVLADENQITWILLWIRYLSIIYYAYQSLAQNELDGNYYGSRDNREIQVPGSFYLNKLGLNDINQWYGLIAVVGLGIIFFIIGYFGLKRSTKPNIVLI